MIFQTLLFTNQNPLVVRVYDSLTFSCQVKGKSMFFLILLVRSLVQETPVYFVESLVFIEFIGILVSSCIYRTKVYQISGFFAYWTIVSRYVIL